LITLNSWDTFIR